MGGREVNHEIDIHLDWSGPFKFADACRSNDNGDWGVYQIYGSHPLYGAEVLLYIGKAERRTFGARLPEPHSMPYCYAIESTTVYLGRLAGEVAPDDAEWNRRIVLAESLLITAHRPAWNSQMNAHKLDAELQGVHIFNWGNHRCLMPEVSGARWTSRLNTMEHYHVFKAEEPRTSPASPTGKDS